MTHEPVSHCAIHVGEFVVHSTILGPEIRTYDSFCKKNTVVLSVDCTIKDEAVVDLITKLDSKSYDYAALLYLGVRYAGRHWLKLPLPKANLWNVTGMYLCTELVTTLVYGKEYSMLTPYQLYLKLIGRK